MVFFISLLYLSKISFLEAFLFNPIFQVPHHDLKFLKKVFFKNLKTGIHLKNKQVLQLLNAITLGLNLIKIIKIEIN